MKNFTVSSILALLVLAMSACAPANNRGSSSVDSADEILGGRTAVPGSALSKQVFMLFGITKDGQYTCTATLITRQHVLTAAHCVDNAKRIFAVFAIDAVAKLKNGNPKTDPDIIEASGARIYKGYGGSKGGKISGIDVGDIAVLRLSKPAPESVVVTQLYNSSLRSNQTLIASGYGIISGTLHIGTGLLRETTVIVDDPMVGKSEFSINQANGRGICSGDSGGPSFVQGSFGQLIQVGIASRVDNNCATGGLYTLVPAYIGWINESVRLLAK